MGDREPATRKGAGRLNSIKSYGIRQPGLHAEGKKLNAVLVPDAASALGR